MCLSIEAANSRLDNSLVEELCLTTDRKGKVFYV